jgi:hypothetical protein
MIETNSLHINNNHITSEDTALNQTKLVTFSAIMGLSAFSILLLGPLIHSASFGFPAGYILLPIYTGFIRSTRDLDRRIPFFAGLVSGVLASFFPFFGGIGPFSAFMGTSVGIATTLLPYPNNKLPYFIHTLLISASLFTIVLWQFSLHTKLPVLLTLLSLMTVSSFATTILYNSKRFTRLFAHLKNTVK